MIAEGSYVHKADVYALTEEQHESGQITETWDYENPVDTVDCLATSFDTESSYVARSREVINVRSFENDLIRFKSIARLSRDDRVGNIRAKHNDEHLFFDLERTDQGVVEEPIIFEVVGSYPVADPFGQVLENVYILERARDL